jgi:membrane-associated protein
MESQRDLLDTILHIDKYLGPIIQEYGLWTYLIIFLIIFSETAFVVTNFLPGDVLVFTAGAFAALGSLDVKLLIVLMSIAAILGDNSSFLIGRLTGIKLFGEGSFLSSYKRYVEHTRSYLNEHGPKTFVFARFIPMFRSLAPFVAGISRIRYRVFGIYNFIGIIIWNLTFVLGGYLFGNIPFVKNNFSIFILAVIAIIILPNVVRLLYSRYS